jgi:hypothetical protein
VQPIKGVWHVIVDEPGWCNIPVLITESSLIFFGKSQIEVALHNQQQS